jgi:hypothetical protein
VATGIASDVRGTPSFYVNGIFQDLSFGFESLVDSVRRELALHANRAAPKTQGLHVERRL